MPLSNLPEPFAAIDELVERRDFAGARAALASASGSPALRELLDVKIGLEEGILAPQIAMNRLLTLMRQDKNVPGAHELYKQASQLSYEERSSSLAHSHPPPPIKVK